MGNNASIFIWALGEFLIIYVENILESVWLKIKLIFLHVILHFVSCIISWDLMYGIRIWNMANLILLVEEKLLEHRVITTFEKDIVFCLIVLIDFLKHLRLKHRNQSKIKHQKMCNLILLWWSFNNILQEIL